MWETCRPHSLGLASFWRPLDVLYGSCAAEHSVTFTAPLGFLPSIPVGSLCTRVKRRGSESTRLKWSWQSPALLVWVKTPKSLWENAAWWGCRLGGLFSLLAHSEITFSQPPLARRWRLTWLNRVWVSWDSFGFPLLWSQMNGRRLRWFSRVSVAELSLPALPFPECYWSPGGNIILRDKSCHLYALFCSVGVSDHLLAGESCKQLCVLQWNHTEPEGVRRTVGSDAKGNLAFLPHPPRVGQSGKATRF